MLNGGWTQRTGGHYRARCQLDGSTTSIDTWQARFSAACITYHQCCVALEDWSEAGIRISTTATSRAKIRRLYVRVPKHIQDLLPRYKIQNLFH